jgi:hypothetical protein
LRSLLPFLLLVACREDSLGIPPAPQADPVPLALVVSEPAAGAFVGDRVIVAGTVTDPAALVWIEGYRANVGTDGSFRVEVPVEGDFRILDVETAREGEHLRERVVVFAGADPRETWTGGVGVRLTPVGLEHVAEILAAQLVALDLVGQIDAALPEWGVGGVTFLPQGVTAQPATATLTPGPEGLALLIGIEQLSLRYDIVTDTLGTLPLELGFEQIALGATVTLGLDADGALAVGLTNTQLQLGTPVLEVAGIDPEILEDWLGSLLQGLSDLLGGLLDAALAALLGELSLPLPEIALPSDLLGFPLVLQLGEVSTDTDGVAAALTVDVGLPPAVPLLAPTLAEAGPSADLALSVHEGLLQGLLSSDLLTMLDLDLELPGFLGEAVALPIGALPGGEQLPGDRTGMCLALAPYDPGQGSLGLARLQDDLSPLATILMPDVRVTVGVSTALARCVPWLEASLALEVALNAEGTAIGTGFEVVDGAILSYGAQGEFSEDELVGGLGGLVDVATSFLGGSLAFDLADLLGGGTLPAEGLLGDLQPRLLDARPGATDGVSIVTLSLWD